MTVSVQEQSLEQKPRGRVLEALLDEERDEVLHAVGVAPLVVVPANDLGCVADDLGQFGSRRWRRADCHGSRR